jgi:archaellum component FlaC
MAQNSNNLTFSQQRDYYLEQMQEVQVKIDNINDYLTSTLIPSLSTLSQAQKECVGFAGWGENRKCEKKTGFTKDYLWKQVPRVKAQIEEKKKQLARLEAEFINLKTNFDNVDEIVKATSTTQTQVKENENYQAELQKLIAEHNKKQNIVQQEIKQIENLTGRKLQTASIGNLLIYVLIAGAVFYGIAMLFGKGSKLPPIIQIPKA